ncbi:hypothetical protein LTR09_005510 [Extremus antarcticus]|uniref:Uncharacterized protein n=1 Tax=Extremus antarcticus TaxID=702011 RepID=A0AAJ0G9F7_9PEZI|nr:hypothetical protein LTR09_005510 [Extremus antarcticus]
MAPLTESYVAENFFDMRPGWLTPEEPESLVPSYGDIQGWRQETTTVPTATAQLRPDVRSKTKLKPVDDTTSSSLRFFVVDHPDQLRDRKQMRKNRKHVMHNYLDKEAKKPESKDTRVRKQVPKQPAPAQASSRLTPADSTEENGASRKDPDSEQDSQRTAKTPRKHTVGHRKASEEPLVPGFGGTYEYSQYMHSVDDVPWPTSRTNLGSTVDPFGTLPAFDDPTLGVDELKYSCTQRFGSRSLSVHWMPTMLKARHAFLSSLCISSAYDDIMRRNLLPPDKRTTGSLMKRLRVRQGVISMINESISDPEMRTADETIIAVLHVLNSEICGCDDRSMKIHQLGLHDMIRERGGLARLGVNGHLARISTITMFMLAALRETSPQPDFVCYASKITTPGPNDMMRYPESPIFCRTSGYLTIDTALSYESATYRLLDLLRQLTEQFFAENNLVRVDSGQAHGNSSATIAALSNKIFAMKPALEQDFHGMNERYTYESLRLVSLVYAYALLHKLPFSKTTARLEDSGVLFFATLIAGATANPGPLANEERDGEDEEARKWLTAIAVRCCITLSFEYGDAVLGTLKRLVAIEQLLSQVPCEDGTSCSDKDLEEAIPDGGSGATCSRGFADFAQEFMSI